MSWLRVCAVSDVPHRRGWPVAVGGLRLAVFRTGGRLRVVDNVCRHTGAPLDDGLVDRGCVTCPWHGWRYDLASGDHLTAFGRRRGVRSYPVRVDGDHVVVEVPDDD